MKRLLMSILNLCASRAVTPLVLLCFLLLYIGIAFFNNETLVTLITFTRTFAPLAVLFAFIPLNCAARLIMETVESSKRRAVMKGGAAGGLLPELFEESLTLPGHGDLAALQERLGSFGYRTRLAGSVLAAWRGISLFPARGLLLLAMFCFFTGILFSTTSRLSQRVAVIEGEPFPLARDGSERVVGISLTDHPGFFLERTLSVEVAGRDDKNRVFGIYPPALHRGYFIYPRYLGVAPRVRFSAPDFQSGFETHYVLMIYPPGKEDSADIPGAGYRIVFSMAKSEVDGDPFRSRRMSLLFKVRKGDELVSSGTVPVGGEFNSNGYRLSFTDFRRVVATDLVKDYGVILIWSGALIGCLGLLYWLPVRMFFPRREMLFLAGTDIISACSRAEGGRTAHGGIFHEALDFLDAGVAAAKSV